MQDLNDLALFAAVVKHKGFSSAARVLNIPKSKLSKHVARLEQQLDVRLLERSTRKLRVTDIGQAFYERCETILSGVEAAEAVVAAAKSEPTGVVRLACPIGFAPIVGHILPAFHRRYPGVRLLITATNRPDRSGRGAHRRRGCGRVTSWIPDNNLIVRKLGEARQFLVASPALMARIGNVTIDTLGTLPTLSMNEQHLTDTWQLNHTDGTKRDIAHQPVIRLRRFWHSGAGRHRGHRYRPSSDHLCNRGIRTGVLMPVLPDWCSNTTIAHLVFTSRHGMLPSVRALIDFIADHLPSAMSRCNRIDPPAAMLEAAE